MEIPGSAEVMEMSTEELVRMVHQHLTEVVWPHLVEPSKQLDIARDFERGLREWLEGGAVAREVLPEEAMRDRCLLYHFTAMLGRRL